MAALNTKLFINKKLNQGSWHCSINQAVTCEPVASPLYEVNIFGT